MDKLADIKANMSRLVAERNALSVSIEETSRRIEQISAQLEADKAELDKVCATLIENAERKTALGEKLQALYLRNNELNALATDTTDKIDKLNEKFYTAQSRRKMLKELQQAYDGFAFSIRNLMNDARKNPELNSKIEGLVAQIISMDAKFETAIETALGSAMQNIVTKTEDDAST